jgi:hypothetical protein
MPAATELAVASTVAAAASAMGLYHGPVHAECRVNERGVFVLEIAGRPIGGLCARALRFVRRDAAETDGGLSLEDLLLRHALGEALAPYGREARASAVMMLPVPGRGRYRRTEGLDAARATPGVDDVVVTARDGQMFVPLPEGHSYPGFIFAHAELPEDAVRAVREAHGHLRIVLDPAVVLTPRP